MRGPIAAASSTLRTPGSSSRTIICLCSRRDTALQPAVHSTGRVTNEITTGLIEKRTRGLQPVCLPCVLELILSRNTWLTGDCTHYLSTSDASSSA